MDVVIAGVILLLCFVGLLIPQMLINGFVFTKLWQWFIVPLGAEPIPFVLAIGLGLTIALLTHQYIPKSEDNDWWRPFMSMYVEPFVYLLVDWIVTWFIK